MKGKVNKGVDNCIYILLKLARDRGYERLVKIEKGKIQRKYDQIMASVKFKITLYT